MMIVGTIDVADYMYEIRKFFWHCDEASFLFFFNNQGTLRLKDFFKCLRFAFKAFKVCVHNYRQCERYLSTVTECLSNQLYAKPKNKYSVFSSCV